MKTIDNNIEHELIIKNSRFITELLYIDDLSLVNSILENIKKKYKDATHYCYAYIIDNVKHFNDDGEPSGTARAPILNVLKKNNLNYVICIVIRYFGGIKLGAGGLIRAYSKSAVEGLKKSKIIDLIDGYKVKLTFSYDDVKNIDYILKNCYIIDKYYNELITYTFLINNNYYEIIKDIINKYNVVNIEKILIKKD